MTSSHSTDHSSEISNEVVEQAAEWLVKVSSEQCTVQDQQDFITWQQQNPVRQQAVANMQDMIEQLQQLQHDQHQQTHIVEHAIHEQMTLERKLNSRSSLFIFTVSTMLAALISWKTLPIDHWLANTNNAYQQWSEHTLLDQSQIHVSGHSAYNIKFDKQQRHIELLDGNILVDVAKDASRPFTVETEFAQIKALGTRFIVQHSDNQTILTMLESKVELRSSNQIQIIHSGQQVVIDATGIHTVQPISPAMYELAWQKRNLIVDQMPLNQVLDILQSYQKGKIYYNKDEINQLRVTAILPLDQPKQAYTLLQDSLPVRISQPIPYITRVKINNNDNQ